jgi:hypothetical protein
MRDERIKLLWDWSNEHLFPDDDAKINKTVTVLLSLCARQLVDELVYINDDYLTAYGRSHSHLCGDRAHCDTLPQCVSVCTGSCLSLNI